MIRWRFCLIVTVLLLLPLEIVSKSEDDYEEETTEEDDNHDSDDDDEDEDEQASSKMESVGRRAPAILMQTTLVLATRTTKKRPLECYVCAHKPDSMLRACLDPIKFKVHTMTCHSVDDKCFTSVISKGSSYEAVVRGCRSGCISSPETMCCDVNHCNNQALAMSALLKPQALVQLNKSTKTFPSSILFFVTILLVLQTVVKVTFV